MPTSWKVGDLAKQTGLSIRTLHYYDEIGLVKPSHHTEVGHRLYTEADIVRLQQVVSLRQLGFSLAEIKECLENRNFQPISVLRKHIAKLNEQIKLQQNLSRLLESIYQKMEMEQVVSVNEFMQAIEVTKMVEDLFNKYYTPEQRQYLDQRKEELGESAIAKAQQDWQDLFAAVQAEMDKGTSPTDEKVLRLAKRWQELIESFTGGNTGIRESLNNLVQSEYSTMQQQFGFPNSELFDYIAKAQAAINQN